MNRLKRIKYYTLNRIRGWFYQRAYSMDKTVESLSLEYIKFRVTPFFKKYGDVEIIQDHWVDGGVYITVNVTTNHKLYSEMKVYEDIMMDNYYDTVPDTDRFSLSIIRMNSNHRSDVGFYDD